MRLVLGFGNWLRRDDGLGVWLAELPRANWTSLSAHQLLPEHAEVISRAECVVFVDAALAAPPGAVQCAEVAPSLDMNYAEALGAFTHHVTPELLTGVARDLYGACPPARLITVVGADFTHGDGFSPEICAQLTEIVAEVDALIAAFAAEVDSALRVQPSLTPPQPIRLAEGSLHA